jgi:ABC-type sulfate/molybdate transport systems ATPase subunit
MHGMTQRSSLWMIVIAAMVAGCAGPQRSTTIGEPIYLANVTVADAVQAAEDVLVLAHFEIEKADPNHGVVRARPLRAAQVFEFWRQDNPTASDVLEADIQTLRKMVEIEFKQADGQLAVNCRVRVQQLSIPEAPTASVSQAYQMHSRSTPTTQTLDLSAKQKRQMAWIDLPDDSILAQRIVERIAGSVKSPISEGAK